LPVPTFWKVLLPSASVHMKMSDDDCACAASAVAAHAADTRIRATRFKGVFRGSQVARSVRQPPNAEPRDCGPIAVHFPHSWELPSHLRAAVLLRRSGLPGE
jgi:hypothetical protein